MSRSSFRSGDARQANGADPERSFSGRGGMMRGRSSGGSGSVSTPANASDRDRTPGKQYYDMLLYCLAHLVGEVVEVETRSRDVFRGVLHACSVDSLGVVLKYAKKKGVSVDAENRAPEVVPTLIIHGSDLVQIMASDIQLDTDVREMTDARGGKGGFQTDSQISNRQKSLHGRELTKFADFGTSATIESPKLVDGDMTGHGVGSWDQFAENERKFGVLTSFDEHEYTTKLDKSDPAFRERERHAAQIAAEIEKKTSKNVHVRSERGQLTETDYDEEALHSAVLAAEGTASSEPIVEDDDTTKRARLTDPSIVKAVAAPSDGGKSPVYLQSIASAKTVSGSKRPTVGTGADLTTGSQEGEPYSSTPEPRSDATTALESKPGHDRQKQAPGSVGMSPPTSSSGVPGSPRRQPSNNSRGKSQSTRTQPSPAGNVKSTRQQSPKAKELPSTRPRIPSPLSSDKKDTRAQGQQQQQQPPQQQQADSPQPRPTKAATPSEAKSAKPVQKFPSKAAVSSPSTPDDLPSKVQDSSTDAVTAAAASAATATATKAADDAALPEAREKKPVGAGPPPNAGALPATSDSAAESKPAGEKASGEKKDSEKTTAEAAGNKKRSKLNANAAEFRPSLHPVAQPVNPGMYYTLHGGEVRQVMTGHPVYPPTQMAMPPNFVSWNPGRGGMIPAQYIQQQRMGVQMMPAPTLPRPVPSTGMPMVPVPGVSLVTMPNHTQQFVPQGMMYTPQPGVQGYVPVQSSQAGSMPESGPRGRGGRTLSKMGAPHAHGGSYPVDSSLEGQDLGGDKRKPRASAEDSVPVGSEGAAEPRQEPEAASGGGAPASTVTEANPARATVPSEGDGTKSALEAPPEATAQE